MTSGAGKDKQLGSFFQRLAWFSLIRPAVWDKYKYLRGVAAVLMVGFTLTSGAGLYEIWKGAVLPYRAALAPVGALLILIAVPKKWDLVVQTLGAYFILSIIGTALGRATLRLGLEMVGITGGAFFAAVYLGTKLGIAQTRFSLGGQPVKGRTVSRRIPDEHGETRSNR